MSARPLLVRWLAFLVLAAVAVPQVDLAVSGWFFKPPNLFILRNNLVLEVIRRETSPVVITVGVSVGLVWLAALIKKKRLFGLDGRRGLYLLTSLALGPGVLANGLKETWGRARPTTIQEFGGDRLFSPALIPSSQCDHNCSFVSGHAAVAFWAVSFALLAPPRWRTAALAAALACGGLMGFVRVAQGGHFLSDVVYAGALVFIVSLGLRRLILSAPENPL